MADPVQAHAKTARLAAALRANLARRKAREREELAAPDRHAQESGDPSPAVGEGAPPSQG